MSDVSTVQAAGSAATTTTTSSTKSALGKDDFLKMMIAQLKHQDPLNPMDGTAFTAQLAQFSSLEQLQNINTQMTTFSQQQQALGNAQAVNLIGKEVLAKGSTVIVDGNPATLSYNLAGDAVSGQIQVFDPNGQLVDTLSFKNQKQGLNSVTWNCPSSAKGIYSFAASALDKSGNAVSASTMAQGTVTGVNFHDGATYLNVGGREIGFSDVVSVKTATN
jgi:flagellar basal-body rod modification protein FlgD